MPHFEEREIYKVFKVSLIFKGLNSIIEIIGGVIFLFDRNINSFLTLLYKRELIEDPTDFIAIHVQKALPYFSTHDQHYASLYLLTHGLVKIFLVFNLLRGKLWAYKVTVFVLTLFIIYQLYRLIHHYNPILVFITLFDILVIGLTWHEYKVAKNRLI